MFVLLKCSHWKKFGLTKKVVSSAIVMEYIYHQSSIPQSVPPSVRCLSTISLKNLLDNWLDFDQTASWWDYRLYEGSNLKTYLLMRWLGNDALAVVGPTGDYLLDFLCSGIHFYVLLSPYLCFISFLYLGLYVLGDDAWISEGSLIQTKHICVLIHLLTKGEAGAVEQFKPSSK